MNIDQQKLIELLASKNMEIAKLQQQRERLRSELQRQKNLCPLKEQSINFNEIQKVLDEN
jgi:hypothetical protein